MRNLIGFLLLAAMYFGLNEACKKNRIEFHNQLFPSNILEIQCIRNNGSILSHKLSFRKPPYIIDFEDNMEKRERVTWSCILIQRQFYIDVDAYTKTITKRCGQLRSWIAKVDGIWFRKRYLDPPVRIIDWNKY